MRKSQKFMLTSVLLAVIVMLTVMPTLSWLSSTSEPVVNTFAGGAISIKLDEAFVDTNGKKVTGEDAKRVNANNYKYVAGAVLDKDPTPTVLKGSEECYVFLLVENGLNDKFTMNYATDAWLKVAESGGNTVYAYSTKVNALESTEDIVLKPIFTTVTISPELTKADIESLGERKLCVTAFAVQTANIDVATATDLAVKQFGLGDVTITVPPIA
ncbi:hypothetical protein [Clostridium facile]|uniref:SipW-cognate class signal peptide n=1 Tax=Clostridium facile TaxID=2763035 RepID=A0ABR7IT20_9CLOT|nr:hypothetical protein [Clostridium facile]MBC5788275.1 hypothetical protein [Clostridium facile]PWM99791.1 MAG: hypothetical protein DBX37_03600 [Massilioclostridium sp.]